MLNKIYKTCSDINFSMRWCKLQPERLEGWPLLTIKLRWLGTTEYKWKGSLLGWFFGLVVLAKEIYVLPWLFSRPNTKYFFQNRTLLQVPLSQSPSELGRQSCWIACLLVCVSNFSSTNSKKIFFVDLTLNLKFSLIMNLRNVYYCMQ